jgi:Protein of unknown function (DUF2829)
VKTYIGTKIIRAKPMTRVDVEALLHRNIGGKQTGPGYLVEYEDGYQSWSPKDVFEAAYREMQGMTFGLVLEALRKGLKAGRDGWSGKGMWIQLQTPDAKSRMNLPYIFICTVGGKLVPWVSSPTDLLAEDWEIVP